MEHTATHPQQLKLHNRRELSSHSNRRDGGHRRTDFPVGLFVEVRTKEEGFTRVYFSATVLPSPKKGSKQKSNKIFVEYHNLLAREDRSDRLREHVDVSFVRPVPPFQEIVKGFKPKDVVDAFFRDIWWIGVVKRVVKKGESFIVAFQDPPDEQELRLDELRVHWDWVDGRWVRPGNQGIAAKMFDVGSKVEVSFDKEKCHDGWFPATILKDLGNGSFLVECNNVNTDENCAPCELTINHIRPNPPLLKGTKIRLLEKVDAHIDSGWWGGSTIRVLENSRYTVFFRKTGLQKEFDNCELRPHLDWTDGKWFSGSKEITVRSSNGRIARHRTIDNHNASTPTVRVVNKFGDRKDTPDAKTPSLKLFQQLTPDNQKTSDETSTISKRNQSLSDSRSALSQSLEKVKEGDVPKASQRDSHHKPVKETLCSPVIPLSVDISTTVNASGDQQLSDNPLWGKQFQRKQRNVGDATLSADGKMNSTPSNMKKCSMPMLQLDVPTLDVGGTVPNSVGNTAEGVQNGTKEETKRPLIIGLQCPKMGSTGHENVRVSKSHCCNSKETMIVSRDKKQKLNGSPIQEIKEITGLDTDKLTNDRSDPKARKGSVTSSPSKRLRRGITDSPGASGGQVTGVNTEAMDDEPLSKWVEGSQPPPGYSGLPPASNIQQSMENGKKQIEVIEIEDDENIPENGILPFIKSPSLWNEVRSMEGFKKLPQFIMPHFKPLEEFRESAREGMALGHMVTFAHVVEKAFNLQFDDPKSTTDEILEMLVGLEKNGFHCKIVQDRVKRLLSRRRKKTNSCWS